MKSIVITLLMFIVVFSLVSFNVLDILDNKIFSYSVRIIFLMVMFCAFIFVGIPQNKYTSRFSKLLKRFSKATPPNKKRKMPANNKSTAKKRGKNV